MTGIKSKPTEFYGYKLFRNAKQQYTVLFPLSLNGTASGLNHTGFTEDEWKLYRRYFQHWRIPLKKQKHLAVANMVVSFLHGDGCANPVGCPICVLCVEHYKNQ